MYEVIVLGAGFAAAGIARQLGERCLVIERRAKAGSEFFGALRNLGEEADLHSQFEGCHLLFCTSVVSVEKDGNGFICVTHGVDGFRTYQAKKIIDTRCLSKMCRSKTFNLLIESQDEPAFANVRWERTRWENRYLLCCPVDLSCTYSQAREMALALVKQFSEKQRLILSADVFDYQVEGEYPCIQNGIVHLPSKAYETPELAFAAGLSIGEEVARDASF